MKTYRQFIVTIFLLAASAISACSSGSKADQSVTSAVQEFVAQTSAGSDAAQPGKETGAKASVTAQSLRSAPEPSSDAAVVGSIKQGQEYAVIGLSSDGEWVQLVIPAIPGGKGWVSANFVTVQGAITDTQVTKVTPGAAKSLPTPTADAGAATSGTATVKTEGVRLRVREQPSAGAKIVGYVYNGESYPVMEKSADGSWVKIGGRNGTDNVKGGWVSSEFLTIN